MAVSVSCGSCGETDKLSGVQSDDHITLACGACGNEWIRPVNPVCLTCGDSDLQTVPLAIVEKSRGTQLSIVGTRPVSLCTSCDASVLRHYHDHRPSPLMPADIPTIGEEQMNA
jgi:hypothetical protein